MLIIARFYLVLDLTGLQEVFLWVKFNLDTNILKL
jgi:hypothetical protein